MTTNAQRRLLAQIAEALATLPDDVAPQVLEFVRTLRPAVAAAGDTQASLSPGKTDWSKVAGTLNWSGDPLAWQRELRAEWPEASHLDGAADAR